MEIVVDGAVYTPKDEIRLTDRVIVRCKNAGVHVGTRDKSKDTDKELFLVNSNRIWRWKGAHDLSEVAMKGVDRDEHTRISCCLPELSLIWTDVCEIIPVADKVDLSEVFND